jgi:hypothetical protein
VRKKSDKEMLKGRGSLSDEEERLEFMRAVHRKRRYVIAGKDRAVRKAVTPNLRNQAVLVARFIWALTELY